MLLQELLASAGDAQLLSYHYADGGLFLRLLLDEPDITVDLQIRTQLVHIGNELVGTSPVRHHLGRVELMPIELEVVNGHYMPASGFIEVIKDTRSGQSLAYGWKASTVSHLFSLVSSSRILTCLIGAPDHISIREVAEGE